jgi:hypothetical protein
MIKRKRYGNCSKWSYPDESFGAFVCITMLIFSVKEVFYERLLRGFRISRTAK